MKKILSLLFGLYAVVSTAQSGYAIGDNATDFKLKNIDNTFVSLSDFEEAKGVILIFTCNTCPYAVAYEDRIEALNKKYAPKGFPVVAIMPNNVEIKPGDSLESMKERSIEKGFTFPYLIDENQEIFPQYGAKKTPHVFVLLKAYDSHVVKYIGAIDDNYKDAAFVKAKYVENAVDALLKGDEILTKHTKAIGCSIKI